MEEKKLVLISSDNKGFVKIEHIEILGETKKQYKINHNNRGRVNISDLGRYSKHVGTFCYEEDVKKYVTELVYKEIEQSKKKIEDEKEVISNLKQSFEDIY